MRDGFLVVAVEPVTTMVTAVGGEDVWPSFAVKVSESRPTKFGSGV